MSIGFDGSQAAGSEIREHLGAAGGDAALLRAIVGGVLPGADEVNADANALQSLVAKRVGEEWRIALFKNTPAQYHGRPELVDAHTAEIEHVRAAGMTIG